MITRLLGLTLTLLALLAVMAHAEEPTGFRDVPFGATEAEVKAKFPEAFCNARSEATSCVVKVSIAEAPVTAMFMLTPQSNDRRVASVFLSFVSKDYELLRDGLIARYGPPDERKQEAISNRMGATFSQEKCFWLKANSAMLISRYGSKIDAGHAQISTREHFDGFSRRAQERREKAKDGF
jgi:hypothetical protein